MDKKVIVLIAGFLLLSLASCNHEKKEKTQDYKKDVSEKSVEKEKKAAPGSYHDMTQAPFEYREYNGQNLSSVGTKTVLFFSQASCGTCQKTDADLKAQESLPEGVSVLKVDLDNEAELNKKYGVTTKHTFVLIDAAGNEIAKEIGLATTADIADFVAKHSSMEKSEDETQTGEEEATSSDDTASEEVEVTETTTDETPETSLEETSSVVVEETVEATPVVASSGMYKEYAGNPGKESVLFFSASWCSSCVAADKNLSSESELSIDTDIFKVDYDSNKDLRTKYGVTSQHTFVRIDAEGNLIKKMTGGSKSSDLTALFN